MLFSIYHQTNYYFSEPVFLEPHIFRFYPSNIISGKLLDFKLEVSPKPLGISFQTDVERNPHHWAWFKGTTKELEITAEIKVKNQDFNPFNFIFASSEFGTIPFIYPEQIKPFLHNYLKHEDLSFQLKDYVERQLAENNRETIAFLGSFTNNISQIFKIEERELGSPLPADETFTLKTGSCRDLAWMQIQLLRSLNIASRFASGYYYVDEVQPSFELHAWVEAYIPGAGWLGLDPTAGLFTGPNYVTIASSAEYVNTYPVQGNIRGSAETSLKTHLNIQLLAE
jgi:transglutaminase-like putative cysteine protease